MALTVLPACGGDDDVPRPAGASSSGHGGDVDAGACAPGEAQVEDGTCRAAGLPPDVLPPGPKSEPQAGVPPGACAEGFVHDGDAGCTPVLPATPCAKGTFAVPGDTACHAPSPCGAGSWGDIPVEPTTQYVDGSYVGVSNGSATQPWTTIQQAVDSAAPGAIVAIAAGSYGPVDASDKPVRLWGRCADLVEVVSSDPSTPSVRVTDAPGAEVHAIGISGASVGPKLDRSPGAVVEALWIHDTGNVGIFAIDIDGPVVTVRDSLIEQASDVGLGIAGAAAVVEGCVVRDGQSGAQGLGHGIEVLPDLDGDPATVALQNLLVEDNLEVAIAVLGSTADIDGSVIRRTSPHAVAHDAGGGIHFAADKDVPSHGTVTRSTIEDNFTFGLEVLDSDVTIDATVIRGTKAEMADGLGGHAVGVFPTRAGPTSVTLRRSLLEQNHYEAVNVQSGTLDAEAVLIRDTQPNAFGGGMAIEVNSEPGMSRASATIRSSILSGNRMVGALVFASDFLIEDSVVVDTQLGDGDQGYAIELQDRTDSPLPTHATVRAVRIERSHGAGIAIQGSEALLESVDLVDTRPNDDGNGIGIFASKNVETARRSKVVLHGSAVRGSRTYGVLVIGSDLEMDTTEIRDTEARETDHSFGGGLEIELADDGDPSSAVVSWSTFEDNRDRGVFAWGSNVTVLGTIVRATKPVLADDTSGGGIYATADPATGVRSKLDIVGSVVDTVHMAGVVAQASDATLHDTLVRGMLAQASNGRFGFCASAQAGAVLDAFDSRFEGCVEGGLVFVDSSGSLVRSQLIGVASRAADATLGDGVLVLGGGPVQIDGARIERVSRAAVSSFGALVRLHDTTLECNPIDLDAETRGGNTPSFENLGGNACGCDGATIACVAQSASLSPPEALPDQEP